MKLLESFVFATDPLVLDMKAFERIVVPVVLSTDHTQYLVLERAAFSACCLWTPQAWVACGRMRVGEAEQCE